MARGRAVTWTPSRHQGGCLGRVVPFFFGVATALTVLVVWTIFEYVESMDQLPQAQQNVLRAAVSEALGGQQSTIDALVEEVRRLRGLGTPIGPDAPPGLAPHQPRTKSLVDTKMAKPPMFPGSEGAWPDWSFKLKAYVAAVHPGLAIVLEQAEAAAHGETWWPDEDVDLDTDQQFRYLLIIQTSEGALQIIKQTPGGVQAYRALARRYNPRCQARSLVQLQGILRFDFGASREQAVDRLVLFERLVTEYEQVTNERLSDQIKCAVLLERLPTELRTHLLLNSGAVPTYSLMRAQVESFLIAGRTWKPPDDAAAQAAGNDPMEVDAIYRKGGKGKEKGKEKKGGKGKQEM